MREQRGVKKMKLTAKTTEEDVVEGEVSGVQWAELFLQDEQGGRFIVEKYRDIQMMKLEKRYNGIRTAVTNLQKYHLWWKPPDQTHLKKVPIFGKDRKSILPGILPNNFIRSTIKPLNL